MGADKPEDALPSIGAPVARWRRRKRDNFLPGERLCSIISISGMRRTACPFVPKLPCRPPPAIRQRTCAPRLRKFEREQLIVDYLNRGVSVAEIAARVGVGEKRMPAVIRGIRCPAHAAAPPEEVWRSRSAGSTRRCWSPISAMTGANLKAVDRVVRIVRELDRYHGFVATLRCLPEASPLEAPVDRTATYGAALVHRPQFALQDDVIARSPQGDVAIQGNVERPTAPGSPRFARDEVEFLRRPSPCLGATIAREFRHKPLKRLNPRPGLRPPPNPRAARVRREKRPVRSRA